MAARGSYAFDVPAYYPVVSRHLYNLLDGLGVSRANRKKNKTLHTKWEVLHHVANQTIYGSNIAQSVCGSRIECATTPGLHSDIDILICPDGYNVIREMSEWRPGKINLLMCEDNNTHPGYVKLQWTYSNITEPVYMYCQDPNRQVIDHMGRTMFPSNVLKLVRSFTHTFQGPAISTPAHDGVIDNDHVLCFPCHNFPTQATQWVRYQRQQGQLSEEFIQKVINFGCLVVPVGHAFSQESHLEWRLSFSLAERWMMLSLNMTQLKCYVLLKLILKSFIKPKIGDNCLSSYHCKTCIFYMVQNTPRRLWCPDNLLALLDMCLCTLFMWVDKGYCPQYFIPQNNLFDTKIRGEVRPQLRTILLDLQTDKCRFLNRIKIDEIGSRLAKACTYTIPPQLVIQHTEETKSNIANSHTDILRKLVFTYKELLHTAHRESGGIVEALIPCIHKNLQHILHFSTTSRLHKSILQSVCNFMKFTIGSHELAQMYIYSGMTPLPIDFFTVLDNLSTDATSSYLKLASMFATQGQYDNAVKVLKLTAETYKHYTETVCNCYQYQQYVSKAFIEKVVSDDPSTERLVQKYAAFCVMFLPTEVVHSPRPLRYEMFRSVATQPGSRDDVNDYWYDWMVTDSITYLYYLQHCCYSALGEVNHRRVALDNLVWAIKQKYNNLGHRETALNLLGDCCMRRGWTQMAYRAWSTSMRLNSRTNKQQHNAAKWHLAILYLKVHQQRNRRQEYQPTPSFAMDNECKELIYTRKIAVIQLRATVMKSRRQLHS